MTYVIGGSGLVGTEICRILAERREPFFAPSHSECDVRMTTWPGLVINCAALNAVDRIEEDPATLALAREVNGEAPGKLARAAERLVHFSTDFVFDGRKSTPYVEDDEPAPLSAYGATKLEGERAALALPNAVVVRTGCLFGRAGRGFTSAIVKRLRAGERVRADAERRVRPTWGRALAEQTLALARTAHAGLFHAMCHGETTWAGFALEVARLAGYDASLVEATRTADLASPAKRPANALLDNARLGALGLDRMPRWEEALASSLAEELA